MKLKKLVLAVASILTLTACGATSTQSTTSTPVTKLTVGINASGQDLWDRIAKRLLKEENIELTTKVFDDYVQPNIAVDNKDIDFNAFQTIIYLEKFNQEKGTKVKPFAYTVIAPMGVYSKKIKTLDELKSGDKVAIPQDTSNNSRALRLLHAAGALELKDPSNKLATKDDIISNPKNLEIVELPAAQTYPALADVAISVINSGVAVEAGLKPLEDAVYLEQVTESSTPYYNVLATHEDRVNDDVFKKVVKVYQTEQTKKDIQETSKGASIPVWEKAKLN